MDKNNNNDTSFSFINQNNNVNEKEKLELPLIIKEPFQNKNKVNKICQYEKVDNSKLKLDYPTFLTSRNFEKNKLYLFKSNNDINNEDKIFKLLREKIEINILNKNRYHYNTNKDLRSNNNINNYLNDASLYKNSIIINKDKNKIKQIKVGRLFTLPNSYNKNCNHKEDLNCKNTIDLRIYKNISDNNTNLKRLKTLDKRHIKNDISGDIQNNWRKNFNCSLKYRYNKNKNSIDEISLKIKDINNIVKKTFDGFKNETDIIFDEISNFKEKKKKKKI